MTVTRCFCRRDRKRDIMVASKKLKPVNLYIGEHLTPMRNTIFYALRKMSKHSGSRIVSCSTYNGNVYAWIKSPNYLNAIRTLVNSREMLEHVSTTSAMAPLSQFLNEWRHWLTLLTLLNFFIFLFCMFTFVFRRFMCITFVLLHTRSIFMHNFLCHTITMLGMISTVRYQI